MRICYIADGKSVHTRKLVNHFARTGHEIHLISSRFSDIYDPAIHLYELRRILPGKWVLFRFFNGLFWLYEVRKLVKKIKPDLLDVHFLRLAGYLGLASGFHPFISNTWGSDILVYPKLSPFHKLIAKAILKKADLIICTSKIQYDVLLEYAPASKIGILPFGVDCEIFKPQAKKGKNHKTIGVVKALAPTYGIEYLILATPYIIKEFENLEVLIIGGGNKKPYQRIVRELRLDNSIKFLGEISHKDVPEYLAQMDVFVMPSVYESFGVAALEAQAMEVPVVASKVGGIPEAVIDGSTGFLVEPKNPSAIAGAVIKLLSDDSLRVKMGKNGREFVLKHYNWVENMEERERLYQRFSSNIF